MNSSNKEFSEINSLFEGNSCPSLIKEIVEMATCLRYLESKAYDEFDTIFEFYTHYVDIWRKVWDDNLQFTINELTELSLTIKFIEIEDSNPIDTRPKAENTNVDLTILYSGGLDSAAGAYILTQEHTSILVHTYHGKSLKSNIRRMAEETDCERLYLIDERFKDDVNYRDWIIDRGTKQNISQLRTITYLFNAIPFAIAHNSNRLVIPENGPMTLNISFSKLAMYTRTSDPNLIISLNKILSDLLPDYNLRIYLPFAQNTKAEMVSNVPQVILNLSESCATNPGKTESCSKCYGCLIRRSAVYMTDRIPDRIIYERTEKIRYSSDFLENESFIPNRKKGANFTKTDEAKALFNDLMNFCHNILTDSLESSEENKILEYESWLEYNYYNNIRILLQKFSNDILFGFYLYYNRNYNTIVERQKYNCFREVSRTLLRIFGSQDNINQALELRRNEIREIGSQIIPLL